MCTVTTKVDGTPHMWLLMCMVAHVWHFTCTENWWLVRAIYVVDGWFLGDFFWKVEGSSAHTRESRAAHMWK